MDEPTVLTQAEHEMGRVIGELGDAELDVVSNCPPRTVRRLASHALKNQLFWAGLVTGHDLMPQDEAMAAFGELPGAVVINFALIGAAAHAWDVAASVGRALEFPPDWIPGMTGVVALTCTEHTVEIGLVKPPTTPPPVATDTQRLMAAAGSTIPS